MNNIFFANRSLEETYQTAFGDSIDEYISTQKRKDRISYTRDNYFRYLFGADPNSVEANAVLMSNKRGSNSVKSFNEMVVQIGDCKEFGNFMRDEYDNFIDKNGNKVKWDKSARNYYDVDGNIVSNSKTLIANPKAEKARDMLEIYYKGGRYNRVGNGINQRLEKVDDPSAEADFELPSFEERNPNFAVACSVMHNDEWHGTPHLHIDFVPIGEGYKKGPEKQLGFERALACMGYTDRIAVILAAFLLTGFSVWYSVGRFTFNVHSDHSVTYLSRTSDDKTKIESKYGLPYETGFSLTERQSDEEDVISVYQSGDTKVTLWQSVNDDVHNFNTEYGSPEEIKINDCEGIYIPENDSEGLVAWVMDGYLFTLNGNIDKMSLLNLAKATNVEK